MEFNSKSDAVSGNSVIITVEEMERRKERFRRATKEYYEQAERGYRSLHGFCSQSTGKRKRMEESNDRPKSTLPRRNSLKRCKRRRNQMHVQELEAHLARSLLESHFAIVELATKEYIFSIENLIRPAPSLLRSSRHLPRVTGGGFLLRVPTFSPVPVALPLPLPVGFNNTQQEGECLEARLQRHMSELDEEQDMAMASMMQAVRESKITKGLAKKIYNGNDSIRLALKKICYLIETNRNNTFYCCHYDSFEPEGEPTIDTTLGQMVNLKGGTCAVSWDSKVVEAQKLDGYYSWFRANNGMLLIQKKDDKDSAKTNGTSDSDIGFDSTDNKELRAPRGRPQFLAGTRKRLRRNEMSKLVCTPTPIIRGR